MTTRFFTAGRRRGRWWLVTPDGRPFFSLGMNHIDSASLRYPENIHIWRERFGASQERYYRVTHDAVRRYDPNHLLLGDRYEGKAPLPDEVLLAAAPWVDVLSFQFFAGPEAIVPAFARWHALTGLPLLLADASRPDGEAYAALLRSLRATDSCVGWHYCGAYSRNRTRKRGFRQEDWSLDDELVTTVTAANRETLAWMTAGCPN